MTTEVEFGTFAIDDLEQREKDGWHYVALRAVPYDHPIELTASRSEVFVRGALAEAATALGRVPFTRGHVPPAKRASGEGVVGVMSSARDGTDAFRAEMKMVKSPLAEETLSLLDVGVLSDVSIGFRRTKGGTQTVALKDGKTLDKHMKVGLDHIALLRDGYGAYGAAAQVEAVRDDLMRLADLRTMLASRGLIT
jgi:hypothetical protein